MDEWALGRGRKVTKLPMGRRTDRPTNIVSFREACLWLKILSPALLPPVLRCRLVAGSSATLNLNFFHYTLTLVPVSPVWPATINYYKTITTITSQKNLILAIQSLNMTSLNHSSTVHKTRIKFDLPGKHSHSPSNLVLANEILLQKLSPVGQGRHKFFSLKFLKL